MCPPGLLSYLGKGSAAITKGPRQSGKWKLASLMLGLEADSPGVVQEAPVPVAVSSQRSCLVHMGRTELQPQSSHSQQQDRGRRRKGLLLSRRTYSRSCANRFPSRPGGRVWSYEQLRCRWELYSHGWPHDQLKVGALRNGQGYREPPGHLSPTPSNVPSHHLTTLDPKVMFYERLSVRQIALSNS